jgi:hypothetical protein
VDRQRLHVIGKGQAGLWCLFAAALDERILNLICSRSLLSYWTLTKSDRYLYGADVFVPEAFQYFDLPDVAAAVAPRSLALIEPKDAMKKTVDAQLAAETYRRTQDAYRIAGAEKSFRIECDGSDLSSAEHYHKLMQSMEFS